MKTFSSIIVALLAAILPATAMTTNSIDEAINSFVQGKNNGKYIKSTNFQESQEADSLPVSSYCEYKFSIDKDNKQFEQLRKAFENPQCKYYKRWTKQAGEEAKGSPIVSYGERSEHTISLGAYKERNYILLCVRDDDNPKWRTCYVLIWYDDKVNKDVYNGTIYKIYSPDPQKVERKKSNKTIIIGDKTFNLNELDHNMDEFNKAMKEFDIAMDGYNGYYFNTDSLSTGNGNIFINGNLIDINNPNKNIKTADDFLNRFSTLRNLYLDTKANTRSKHYKTSLINQVVSLCKNKASVLSAEEKEVCAYGIKEMQKQTSDEYDKKMFDVALKALK